MFVSEITQEVCTLRSGIYTLGRTGLIRGYERGQRI
jgi:hypothetical protein